MIEIGILPQKLRVYVDQDRAGWRAGWTEWTQSHFTPPFARTEVNKFSELPELENISNFHPEMRGWVDSIRTGAPVVAPVADAWRSPGSSTPATAPKGTGSSHGGRDRMTNGKTGSHDPQLIATCWVSAGDAAPPPGRNQPHPDPGAHQPHRADRVVWHRAGPP